MSACKKLTPTNMGADELVMDKRGEKDSRFYCLPPFHGDRRLGVSSPSKTRGRFPLHLVFQGHRVGLFSNWAEAKTSLSGFPESGNQGYHSEDEAIDAWQAMCMLGVHPHPVDPAFVRALSASASALVNTSPWKSELRQGAGSHVKREDPSASSQKQQAILQPAPSARQTPAPESDNGPHINFAIRGGGIISSSANRSQERYQQLQREGAEPDMLVTRSFERASLFALEEDVADGEA
ncbi:hypothetical protein DFH09DRAFT_1421274 [Mycena vulgaris]|nr:hypothetical protein DFH09DRAFT_1421274 [Mycena vulgaris]